MPEEIQSKLFKLPVHLVAALEREAKRERRSATQQLIKILDDRYPDATQEALPMEEQVRRGVA